LVNTELVERGYTHTELEGKDWKELTAILKAQDQKLYIKLMHDDNMEDGVLGACFKKREVLGGGQVNFVLVDI